MAKPAEQVGNVAAPLRSLEAQELLGLLPHRYPFLLVDRIIEIRGDESCIGIKNVTVSEPYFLGHFPGRPIFPGVLLIEGMAQTAGAIVSLIHSDAKAAPIVYLLTVDKAKFRKPVLPGDTVKYHLQRINRRRAMWWYRGEAKVDGQIVAEAEVGAMLGES